MICLFCPNTAIVNYLWDKPRGWTAYCCPVCQTVFNYHESTGELCSYYIEIDRYRFVFWSATLFMDRAQKQATTLWYGRSHNDRIILKVFDTILHITPFDIAHKLKTILVFS
jgi:hypothetical protein